MIPRLPRRDPRNQAFSRLASECQGPAPEPLDAAGRKAKGSEERASHLPHPASWECPGTSLPRRKLCSGLSAGRPRGEEEVGKKHEKSLDTPPLHDHQDWGVRGYCCGPSLVQSSGASLGYRSLASWPGFAS